MGQSHRILSNLKLHLVSLSSFLILLVLSPLVILIWTPVLLYRKTASLIAPLVYPGVKNILTFRSTNFSNDDLYNHEENLTIFTLTLEGNLELEILKKVFLEKVLKLKLPNGAIRYPELKQCYFHCLGFRFWKSCEDTFDINDHIKLYSERKDDHKSISEGEFLALKLKLLNTPFKENKSPWEVHLVHNYVPDDPTLRTRTNQPISVVLIKIHHGLGDGFALKKLTIDGIFDPIEGDDNKREGKEGRHKEQQLLLLLQEEGRRKRKIVKLLQDIWDVVSFPVRSIYEFAHLVVETIQKGPLHVPPNNKSRAGAVHACSQIISCSRIKRIKNELDVSFTSVLFSVAAGAISKLMIRKNMKLPESLPVIIPVPLPGHPDTLRNHLTNCVVYLPLSPNLRESERLSILNDSYDSIKRSTIPMTGSLVGLLIGGMFTRFTGTLLQGLVPGVVISSFPGSDFQYMIEGHANLESHFFCGLLNLFGLGIYILTMAGDLKVAVSGSTALVDQEDMEYFVASIQHEIELLESLITPHSVTKKNAT